MLFILVLTMRISYGQIVVNGTDINKLESGTHIQVHAQEFNSKVTVTVDYGQEREFDGRKISKAMVDDGAEKKVFKSPVNALNFFLTNGWELVDFAVTVNELQVDYTYLLKRQKQ
jgi:hypothetical protein